jgi:hypothetical protein
VRRLASVAIAMALVSLVPPHGARAAEYEMATAVRYVVDPAAGRIAVTAEVTFTNTFPNPAGQISGFDHVDLAIQAGASEVAAADERGSLQVDLAASDGALLASVRTRSRVRYEGTVSFSLSYVMADGATPDLHVQSRVVKFPAWGFGTSSQVTVSLPAGYEVRADGDPMLTETGESGLSLTSGAISAPDRWLAVITAIRPGDYVTRAATVALASGTIDLQVRSWGDDPAWGDQTLSLLAAGLPMLEDAIGLPYPRVGPLVVTEAAGGEISTGELPPSAAEIEVAFDGSAFTLLHQAAHIWISIELAADRWIREGLASHYAARVAVDLGVPQPFDPAARAAELAADAQPLASWGASSAGPRADAYGYAASWALIDRIVTEVGEEDLGMALRRITTGLSAYDATDPDVVAAGEPRFSAVDTRRFLDQLAAVGGVDLAELFEEAALGPDSTGELGEREQARADYRRLVALAGDWGAPDPIRADMSAWRFDEARSAIGEATAWLGERDELLARVATAGMAAPDRLRERFALDGGGPGSRAELDAERAVVDSYLEVHQLAVDARGPLDRIGLFGGADPQRMLAEAGISFGDGELQEAATSLDRLRLRLDRAQADGVVRLAGGAMLVALIGFGVGATVRRRAGSHYTAAP